MRMKEIVEKYGEEYMLRQLAEECCELAQAALKLIRARNNETPMREDEAEEKFMEELADVSVMWREFTTICSMKHKRIVLTMCAARKRSECMSECLMVGWRKTCGEGNRSVILGAV